MAGSIIAHGATLEIDSSRVRIIPSLLAGALGSDTVTVDVHTIKEVVTKREPTAFASGVSVLERTGADDIVIDFAPNGADHQRAFASQVEAALRGEAPVAPAIMGLNFVAVDVETANEDWGSICQIGITKVVDGNITDTLSWLCKPPAGIDHFDAFNISIHGINETDVANAPLFKDLLPEVLQEIGDQPVVAHNAQFDMTAFLRACAASDITPPPFTFGCSLALTRAAKLGIENHRLPTVAQHFDVAIEKHHDAGADAQACAGIIVGLAKRAEEQGSFADIFDRLGFTMGELQEKRVYPVLKKPSATAPAQPHGAQVSGEPTEQTKRAPAPWAKVATPDVAPEANEDADPDNLFYEQNVTLTGDFEPFDKGLLWKKLADNGATIGKNVTKKTTMLVIGPWASVTSKQKRAEELREKGQDITFLTSEELFKALGLDAEEQPPF